MKYIEMLMPGFKMGFAQGLPLLLVIVLLFAGLMWFARVAIKNQLSKTTSHGFPYKPAGTLFTPAERSFLGVLDQAVGSDYRVFGKVRVADIAVIKPGLSQGARQGALNRIASKHVDFLVCDAQDLSVVCVVELNDRSHATKKAQARDELLAGVCQSIGIPLLAVTAKAGYSVQDVRKQFEGCQRRTTTTDVA